MLHHLKVLTEISQKPDAMLEELLEVFEELVRFMYVN